MPDPKDTSKTQRLKKVLWESNLNTPIRGFYNLMNTPYETLVGDTGAKGRKAVEDSLDAASGITVGSAMVPKPRGAITMGANRRGVEGGSRPAKNTKGDSQGPKKPTEARDAGVGSKPGQKKLMDTLEASRQKGAKDRNTFRKDSGTATSRVDSAKKSPPSGPPPLKPATSSATRSVTPRKPRPGEKKFIGPVNRPQPGERKFIGPVNKPKPGEKNFIGPRDKPRSGDKDFIGPMNRPAKPGEKNFIGPRERPRAGDEDFIGPMNRAPKSGEKGFIGPMKPTPKRTFGKMKAGAAAGAGLLGYASYRSADKPSAQKKESPRDDRASSGSSKADAFRAKQQGMKVDGSPTKPKKDGPKKAGDKSRVAGGAKTEKKMSNFERMKKRGYEKEGFGSRSMTSRGAESRVKKERSFKFKDLFAKKKK
jgi:hypothetical protein